MVIFAALPNKKGGILYLLFRLLLLCQKVKLDEFAHFIQLAAFFFKKETFSSRYRFFFVLTEKSWRYLKGLGQEMNIFEGL